MVMFRQKILCTLCLSMMAVGRVSSYYLEILTTVNDITVPPVLSTEYEKALFTALVQIVWCNARTEFFSSTTHSLITLPLPALGLLTSGDEGFLQIEQQDKDTIKATIGIHTCATASRALSDAATEARTATEANPNALKKTVAAAIEALAALDAQEVEVEAPAATEVEVEGEAHTSRRLGCFGTCACCKCLMYGIGVCDGNACAGDGQCTPSRKLRGLSNLDTCNLTDAIIADLQRIFLQKYNEALLEFDEAESHMFDFLDDETVHFVLRCEPSD